VESITIYGSYKTAYKSGGYGVSANITPGITTSDLEFAPEIARGFEVGAKTELLDRQVRLNVDAFTTRYTGLQFQYFNSATLGFNTVTSDARTRGVELDAEYAPRSVGGLTLSANVNYDDAYYTRFLAPCFAGETIGEGCAVTTATGLVQDLKGAQLPSAPRWTGSLTVEYKQPINDKLVASLAASGRYSSSYNVSPLREVNASQGQYTTLDMRASIATSDNHLEFSVIGKNLTNKWIETSTNEVPGTGTTSGLATGIAADGIAGILPPRTVVLQATWRM
jgi:outer membrane receptor protein involved in Fe transport